jgi:serine/threonine protein kinase
MSEQGTTRAKINETITSQISKVNKIRKILYEVATAVAYLHEKGIIHRDVKPDNIFVSHVDLGLVRTPTSWGTSGVPAWRGLWSTSALWTTQHLKF